MYKRKNNTVDTYVIPMKKNKVLVKMPYGKVLMHVSKLRSVLNEYLGKYDNSLMNEFKTLYDNIPVIVFWGNQSSGKSSCLHKMIPEFEKHVMCQGLGTLCPIEIRVGAIYENRTYIEYYNNGLLVNTDSIKNIEDAETKIKNDYNNNVVCAKIIQEIYSENLTFIIVDLPGCTNDMSKSGYYENLKKMYLDKPNTIIFHTCQALVDPANDHSVRYLDSNMNKIIKVVTFTDTWNEKTCGHIKYLDKFTAHDIALVNTTDDDTIVLKNYETELKKYSPIWGNKKLREFMMKEQKFMTMKLLPDIQKTITLVEECLEKEFADFGRIPPPMREICRKFRSEFAKRTNGMFTNQNTEYAKDINNIKYIINSEESCTSFSAIFDENVPSEELLAEEIKIGSRRQIEGTESCNDIVMKYLDKLFLACEDHYTKYVETRLSIVIKHIEKIIMRYYNAYSDSVQNELVHQITCYINGMIKNCVKDVLKFIEITKKNPHIDNIEQLEFESYQNTIYEPIRKVLEEFCNNWNANMFDRIKGILDNDDDLHILLSFITKDCLLNNDIYKSLAYRGRKICHHIWCKDIEKIRSFVIKTTENYDRIIEEFVKDEINSIGHDKFSEKEETSIKRKNLLQIEEKCEMLSNVEIE